MNVCTFKISYHQGTLPLSSPGGRGVNMSQIISLKRGLDQVLFSKGYELTFKDMSGDKAHDPRLILQLIYITQKF